MPRRIETSVLWSNDPELKNLQWRVWKCIIHQRLNPAFGIKWVSAQNKLATSDSSVAIHKETHFSASSACGSCLRVQFCRFHRSQLTG